MSEAGTQLHPVNAIRIADEPSMRRARVVVEQKAQFRRLDFAQQLLVSAIARSLLTGVDERDGIPFAGADQLFLQIRS